MTAEVERSKGKLVVDGTTYTATVHVRHRATCKETAHDCAGCNCRKSVLTYDGRARKQKLVSAKTRSWSKAEDFANRWLNQFDPTIVELERQSVTVEKAVVAFVKDMRFRLGDTNSVRYAENLYGYVDGDSIKRNGHLLAWLATQTPRPMFAREITPTHLMDWRNSWTCGDLTAYIRWTTVKAFFTFAVNQGWINDSPARNIKRPSFKRGNRTCIFTDEQYTKILKAARGNQRLEIFLELLRWSGMAIIDAVEFRQDSVDSEGVLKYRRVKTGTLATVPLPDHVLALLRLAGDGQPFRRQDIEINSDIAIWRKELQALFAAAGVTKVQTDVGLRTAHPHMLRDTFAVSMLRHGAKLHTVSKMLGHSSVKITEHSYLPWVTELEKAHIDDAREAVAKATPKPTSRVVRMISKK